ncbi:MAG: polyprenyl synthetase family protein [bacterium]
MIESAVAEDFKIKLREWKRLIDERLFQVLNTKKPPILYEPITYILESGGKRIRPILLILSCKAVGGNVEDCLDAAVAVELLHNFTLVHDDIMDQDDTRRGRPTVHKKWDTDVALLAGDGLVALAYQSLLRTNSLRINEITTNFTNAIVELCEGQALDREFESLRGIRLFDYLNMIEKKTARLLNISAKIGAIIGGGDDSEIDALGKFGLNLGLAFQIQDDLLDITSDEVTLGKTFGSDVMRRKQTFLLVHALSHADFETKRKINFLLSESSINKPQIIEITSLFEKIGSIEAAKSAIGNYLTSAQKNIDELKATFTKDDLSSFLNYISNRNA